MGGVVSAIAPFIDNRPSSFCKDDKGQLTGNPFVTTRTLTLEMVEVQAMAGYLQCGGLKGDNLRTLTQVDLIMRGGRDLFFWGLDGNVPPGDWMNLMIGDKNWLDFMNAEILTVGNSNFTCRGKEGTTGGSMIDYFIISKNLVPLVRQLVAVFDVPWGPHFGLSLTLNARPSEVLQRI